MSQKDFNRMLGDYLDTRVKPSKQRSKTRMKQKKPKDGESELEILPGDETMVDRMFRKVSGYFRGDQVKEDVDDQAFLSEEEAYQQEVQPTLWERFTSLFSSERGRPETFVEDREALEEEVKEIIEKEEELREEEETLEERKEHFLRRFLRSIGFGVRGESVVEGSSIEAEDSRADDLKDLAKIATTAMKLMDKRHFESFKKTEDFERFKRILERNDLIRK